MNNGYIKLYRKSIDSQAFKNEGLWQVWTWCLMKANHKEAWLSIKTGRGETQVHILPGQFIFGRKSAAKELRMKESSIRNRMVKLKNMQNLDMQPDTHYSIVTIINWEIYQDNNLKEDRQEDRQRTTKGQPKDTNKNDKNEKKEIYVVHHDNKKIPLMDGVKEVLEVLNEERERLVGKKLTPITADKDIIARLKEKDKTVNQACRIVIAKANDEYFINHVKYFHPTTLFRQSHWAKYKDEAELMR